MGVHKYGPTAAVQGDMGWLSLKYRRYIVMLRFWNRLVRLDETRLVKRIFMFYADSPNNWGDDIRQIAEMLHLDHVWHRQGLFDIEYAKSQCNVMMNHEWKIEVCQKPKLRTYIQFKHDFGLEPYLRHISITRYSRSILAQLRVGILPLHIETGRFKNITDQETGNIRKLLPNERVCGICNSGDLEDEIHFLFKCHKYQDERVHWEALLSRNINGYMYLTIDDKLNVLFNIEWNVLIKMVMQFWDIRKDTLYK